MPKSVVLSVLKLLAIGTVISAASALLPAGGRVRTGVRSANAAPSCPIVVRLVYHPDVPASVREHLETAFDLLWAPNTDLQQSPSNNPIVSLQQGTADVILLATPIGPVDIPGKYEWALSANGPWIATRDNPSAPRYNSSPQVRADDYINFLIHDPAGRTILMQHGIPPVPERANPPIPDWDVDMNYTTSLTDLGAVSTTWGQSSGSQICKGWIRPDGNNSANVSIADIGVVTNKWGLSGFSCTPTHGPSCLNPVVDKFAWMDFGGMYSYEAGCGPWSNIDPVTVLLRYHGNSATETLQEIGLTSQTDTQRFIHQEFPGGYACVPGDIGLAENDGLEYCWTPPGKCVEERWHVRGNVNNNPDPGGGTFAHLTPHRDESDGSIYGCNHWVAEAYHGQAGFSGFDAGRDWLFEELVEERGHNIEEAQYWDNRLKNEQCAGPPGEDNDLTGSDGYVYVIEG